MNKYLYGNEYTIPDNVLKHINKYLLMYPNNNGIKRAKNLLKSKSVSYSSLKRLKNFYDEYEKKGGDKIQYELSGGDLMKDFVNQKLKTERKSAEIYKKNTEDIRYNNDLKVHNPLKESIEGKQHYVLGVIFNKDKRILLLKRSKYEDQWQPNKWGLPGGKINDGESSLNALKREIKEETGIEVFKQLSSFSIMRDNNIEHVYICLYNGDDEDVELNFEHSGYGWFSKIEINFLDTVPNLIEYIDIAITKY